MIYAGIDVAKDKHDCLIIDSNGKALSKVFTITNNKQGFDELLANLKTHSKDFSKLKVGLEARIKPLRYVMLLKTPSDPTLHKGFEKQLLGGVLFVMQLSRSNFI
jgi:transposase